MPERPNKFSLQNLREFDKIDLALATREQTGTSKNFSSAMIFNSVQEQPAEQVAKKGFVVSLQIKGAKKTVKLDAREMAELSKACKQKLRANPKSIKTAKGEVLTQELLDQLPDGALLIVQ